MDPETPAPTPDPAAPPATPTFVPSDDFKRFQEQIQGVLSAQTEALSQITKSLGSRAPAPAAAASPRVTDEEIEAAIRTGEGAAPIMRRLLEEKGQDLVRTQIDPLRSTGFAAIEGVVSEQSKSFMPHYDRFKKEIEEYIDAMPADAKLNPKVRILAHDAVVGRHVNELLAEAKEAAIRQATEPPKPESATAGRSGRATGAATGGIPAPEEVFGKEAMDALEFRGLTADDQAKRMGYKDFKDYYEKAIKVPA